MANRELALDEWYHCYSRGVDKRTVFESDADFARFTQLLYLANSTKTLHRSELTRADSSAIFHMVRGETLVAIGAYCLMPNHFHLLLSPKRPGGVSEFMRKVGIAYAMYFNLKNDRVGNLFVKPFRAKHVSEDDYFRRVADYIHLNPAELFEPGWKMGKIKNLERLGRQLQDYAHSSFPDYLGESRAQASILDADAAGLIGARMPDIQELLIDTLLYYRELPR